MPHWGCDIKSTHWTAENGAVMRDIETSRVIEKYGFLLACCGTIEQFYNGTHADGGAYTLECRREWAIYPQVQVRFAPALSEKALFLECYAELGALSAPYRENLCYGGFDWMGNVYALILRYDDTEL